MQYITVRNTPIQTATRQHNFFAQTRTYIDYQGSYHNALGSELRGRLNAGYDGSHDSYFPRDTCTYWTDKPRHVVFNVLAGFGYKVVAAITIDQTAVWTLHWQE